MFNVKYIFIETLNADVSNLKGEGNGERKKSILLIIQKKEN